MNEKPYIPTKWIDQVTDGGGTVIQVGTPMNAANFNNQENGILANNALGAVISQAQRAAETNGLEWEVESAAATLTGSGVNLSVSLTKLRNRTTYNVGFEISSVTGGTAGDIIVSGKQANGYQIKYSGTATSITGRWRVQGGMV